MIEDGTGKSVTSSQAHEWVQCIEEQEKRGWQQKKKISSPEVFSKAPLHPLCHIHRRENFFSSSYKIICVHKIL